MSSSLLKGCDSAGRAGVPRRSEVGNACSVLHPTHEQPFVVNPLCRTVVRRTGVCIAASPAVGCRTPVRTWPGGPHMADVTLTPRQREILEVIEQHQRDRGFPPSVREIGEKVGLTSPSTVHAHLA